MSEPAYAFAVEDEKAEFERLRLIEEEFDPVTLRLVDTAGVALGARCLEVGPGGGSVTRALADRVGSAGRVTAVDLDSRYVRKLALPQVEVVQADVTTHSFAPGSFDFIHARYVLLHLRPATEVLARMVTWLKPGGFILVEEPDFSAYRVGALGSHPRSGPTVCRVWQSIVLMYVSRQLHPLFGLKVPGLMENAGLSVQTVQNTARLCPGGSVPARIMASSVKRLSFELRDTGIVTEKDLEEFGAVCRDPKAWLMHYSTLSTLAQKP